MGDPIVIPGPETLVLFGVHVKVLSALFGWVGIGAGLAMAPVPAAPLGWRRQAGVIVAGAFLALAIAITTGQQPLVVFAWCIGSGYAGITIYQAWGQRAQAAAAGTSIEELRDRLSGGGAQP